MPEYQSLPERLYRWGQRFTATGALTSLLLSTYFGNTNEQSEYTSTPAAAVTATAQTVCEPLNERYIQARATSMQQVTQAKLRGEGKTRSVDVSKLAERYGATVVDIQPYLKNIRTAEGSIRKLAAANDLTQKKFGFSIVTASYANADDIGHDLESITRQLRDIPVELAKAVDLDTVIIESPEPAKLTPPAAAFADLGINSPNNITIGPGAASHFSHEFGHETHGAYLEQNCSPLITYYDPILASANPPGFTYVGYGKQPKKWQGIVTEPYGAVASLEDHATIDDDLLEQESTLCSNIARSDIIARKVGIVVLEMNAVAPKAGDFAKNYFLQLCPTREPVTNSTAAYTTLGPVL